MTKFGMIGISAAMFAAGLGVASIPAHAAFGYCSVPFAPSFYGSKPSKPYCATTRSCSRWEVDSYQADVERHFRKLRDYANEVDSYYSDAEEYIRCMSDLD